MIIPDLYIFRMYISKLTESPVKYLYFLPSILLITGLAIAEHYRHRLIGENGIYAGWFMIVCLLIMLPKLLFFLCDLFDWASKDLFHWRHTLFGFLSYALPIITILVIVYGSVFGRTQLRIKEVTYNSPKIPQEFDGYKIALLADIHIGSLRLDKKFVKRSVEKVNGLNPDLIVFAGDLVNHKATELEGFENILDKLSATDGVYSVLGNHDYGPYYPWNSPAEQEANVELLEQKEKEMGWILLNNEHVYLHRGNDSIALIGVENWGLPPFAGNGDLKMAMEGLNANFKILVSHNPTHWDAEVLPDTDIDITLAGHTHALQLAFWRLSPAAWVYNEWGGIYTQDNQSIYVNVGLGFVGIPFRFGAWPEITVITLEKDKR